MARRSEFNRDGFHKGEVALLRERLEHVANRARHLADAVKVGSIGDAIGVPRELIRVLHDCAVDANAMVLVRNARRDVNGR